MAKMPFIPFGPWAPDRSEFNTQGTEQALNVIRTANGYRPFPGLADTGFTLLPEGQPTGMFFGKDVNGNARQFAAVYTNPATTGMYEMDVGGAGWDRVGTWNLTNNKRFWNVQFGDLLFVTNYDDYLRFFSLSSGSDFLKLAYVTDDDNYRGQYSDTLTYVVGDQVHFVSSAASDEYRLYTCAVDTSAGEDPDDTPASWTNSSEFVQCQFIRIVGDFLVGAYLNEAADGLVPNRVRWSALGLPLHWSLNGNEANLSDYQDVPDVGENRGLVGGEFGSIMFEKGIVRMDFIGPPAVFSFNRIENARGCSEPNSVVTEGQNAYYLSDDGWAKFDGQQVTPIGAEIFDRWFANESAIQTRGFMSARVDPQNQLIIWGFDSGQDATDINDTALVYDYAIGEPSYAHFPHSLLGDFVSPGYDIEDVTGIVITDQEHYAGKWDNQTDYVIDGIVVYGNTIYRALLASGPGTAPVEPGTDPLTWDALTTAPDYKGQWQANGTYTRNGVTANYAVGDRVEHLHKIWEALDAAPFDPQEEPSTGTSWQDNSATEMAASIDDLTTSLDGVFYKAGAATFGALQQGLLKTFTGVPDKAVIDTSEQRLGGEKRAKIQMIQTAIEGIAQEITVQVGTRNRLGKAVAFGPERKLTADGQYSVLQDSRYQRVRVNIVSTDTAGWSDATGVFVRAQPTSLR